MVHSCSLHYQERKKNQKEVHMRLIKKIYKLHKKNVVPLTLAKMPTGNVICIYFCIIKKKNTKITSARFCLWDSTVAACLSTDQQQQRVLC